MKVIKQGIPHCKCIFEDSSNEIQSNARDMPSKYVVCPTYGHYVFKSNGRRIKSVNII